MFGKSATKIKSKGTDTSVRESIAGKSLVFCLVIFGVILLLSSVVSASSVQISPSSATVCVNCTQEFTAYCFEEVPGPPLWLGTIAILIFAILYFMISKKSLSMVLLPLFVIVGAGIIILLCPTPVESYTECDLTWSIVDADPFDVGTINPTSAYTADFDADGNPGNCKVRVTG